MDVVDPYDGTKYGSHGNDENAFVAIFDTKDSFTASLDYATYLGGANYTNAEALTIDSDGNIYISGQTTSTTGFPTVNAYQSAIGGGYDTFLAKLDPDAGASGLIYCTYLGGPGEEWIFDIATDSLQHPIITGRSDSSGWPSINAIDGSYNSGGRDIVIAHFFDGDSILFSSYLGGSHYDAAYGVAVGKDQSIYIAAKSNGDSLFTGTILGYDKIINGDTDAVLIKIAPGANGCQPGDVNDDGTVDRNDVIFLTAYFYSGGPAPTDISSAQINNCDASVNVLDLNALLAYVTGCTTIGCTSCSL